MGLAISFLAAIPKISGLIQFSEQLNQQGGNALYFRALLNDLAFHFIINWVMWTLVVAVIVWLWRKSKGLLIALLVILALAGAVTFIAPQPQPIRTPARTAPSRSVTPQARHTAVFGSMRPDLATCTTDPNCKLVTAAPPWQNWTPESSGPTWTPRP